MIASRAAGDGGALRRQAALAVRRFGHAARTLEPAYTLEDFCYAVRRDAAAAVGPADERYGTAPGWELDDNVRASRAGFAAVWVGGAYVHRMPVAERPSEAERAPSRRLYQDRFCGRQCAG